MSKRQSRITPDRELPRPLPRLLGAILPSTEGDEVLSDLAAEYVARRDAVGRPQATRWAWRQVLVSLPALAGRGWWRGWSGFETRSERLRVGEVMLESWAIDVRFATRRLRRRPLYTFLTVLTLALGVAGTAAVYGVAERLLLEPLPFRDEEEVVVFWFEGAWSEAEFDHLRPLFDEDFRGVAAFRHADATLRRGEGPAQLVRGVSATAELFEVLGTAPVLGSGFRPGDDRPGAEKVAILSHALWRELGGRSSILGEQIELSGEPRTVLGVMPEGFWFADPGVRVWLSEEVDPTNGSGNYGLVGRLPPGVSISGMDLPLERITRSLGERWTYPEEWDVTANPELIPVRERILGGVRPALLALLAAVAAILLVACINVAALMLGQVEGRGAELAMRRALGAGRRRLLQQLVVESLVIGALAAVVGGALAVLGFRFLVEALPLGALAEQATLHWTLFAAALAVAILAATAVAVLPGLTVIRSDLRAKISRGRSGGVEGRGGRLEHALVIGQVALVLILAASAALLVRSVDSSRAIDPGIDIEPIAVLDIQIPTTVAADGIPQLLDRLVAELESVAGVESAAATQRLPLRGTSDNWGILLEDRPELTQTTTAFRVVTADYFRTMGIPLLAGRGLLASDRDPQAAEGVVVINRALAEKYFPGEDPLGRRIAFSERWDRIVGVVGNVAEGGLETAPVPTRYGLHAQTAWLLPGQTLVVRAGSGLDPVALLDASREAVQRSAPGVAVRDMTTMENVFTRAIGPAVQVMSLITVLAVLALTLGAIGIYGVVSHFVTRRRRDWGIRIALGLRPARVAGQILGRGLALVGAGLALGLIGFLLLAHLLERFLYGVGAKDPLAITAAAAILLVAGVVAAAVPARRASRVDPAVVLRES